MRNLTRNVMRDPKVKKALAKRAFAESKTQPRKWGQDAAFAGAKKQREMQTMRTPPGKERPSSYWTDVLNEAGGISTQRPDQNWRQPHHTVHPPEACKAQGGVWRTMGGRGQPRHGHCAMPTQPPPQDSEDPEDTHVQDREEASEHPGLEVDQEETEKWDAVRVDDSTTQGPETMPMEEKKGVNPLLLIGAAAGALLLATR